MANLQVRDMDDQLYESLRQLANNEKRSISQEVIYILEQFISNPLFARKNPTDEFLKFSGSWEDDRTADEIIVDIKNGRENSKRFGYADELFD